MREITDAEFAHFRRFIYETAGITLSGTKKSLVHARLAKRLHACGITSFGEYSKLLDRGDCAEEVQTAIDLLTTNETYFFREPEHFERLRSEAIATAGDKSFRVWSAAGSSGEEAYSAAMVLQDALPGKNWEVIGSDISTRALARAQSGHYPARRIEYLPGDFLKRFCLKGSGLHAGTLLIARQLREKVQFQKVNLNTTLPSLGTFDVVFLRNVLIYFNYQTKREVVTRVLAKLKPGGLLLIGHSDCIADLSNEVTMIAPSVFRKPR